ncbi:MAG: sugar transporter permease, partial [Firmicutes bacterium]|nr:sugar transporter permease [Bacillota bacterium]
MVESRKGFQIIANIVLIILGIFCLTPFILLMISSVTDELTLVRDGYSFLPKKLSFDAYKFLLVDSTNILKGYAISMGVTLVGTLANVFLTVLFAYP